MPAVRALVPLVVLALAAGGCLFTPERRLVPPPAAETDATASLQAELDQGGRIFLPRLPGGACYRTHGLWVSRPGTELTSDGACLEALGPGPVRAHSPDGDAVAASAVLFVARTAGGLRPFFVRISGLRIVVPRQAESYGIAVFGDDVVIRDVSVEGDPIDALAVGGRGSVPARDVTVEGARLLGGRRNVVSIVSAVGLRIEHSVIRAASDDYQAPGASSATGNPAAGIDLEPDDSLDPIVDVRIAGNTIEANGGPGILLALSTDSGPPRRATNIAIAGNRILDNDRRSTPPQHGGIAFQGGQADGRGVVRVTANVISGNRGAGLQGHPTEGTTMRVLASGNDLRGNEGGPVQFVRVGAGSRIEDA